VNALHRTLLCPTDLSPTGGAAVRTAYELAGPSATVHLLHVVEPLVPAFAIDGTRLPRVEDPVQQEATDRRIRAALRDGVPERALATGVRTRLSVRRGIGVATEVLEEARRVGADVIVIGTHGRSALARALMGSVAAEVLRRAEVEVVLVRPPRLAQDAPSPRAARTAGESRGAGWAQRAEEAGRA
jgi:nucleotide-binding universal stress UspA family protein